ncbi:MAG: DUF4080 domain-containing protein, partial [Desulfuromonadales bacterium]
LGYPVAMRTLFVTLHSKFIHASLALPCLAAYCVEDCGDIAIREFTVHEPKENVLAALLAEEPDVIAFSVYLWNRRNILDLLDALAVARPKIRLVVGGPEVSYEDADLFRRHPGLTAVIRGEGEGPIKELLGAWRQGEEPADLTRIILRRGHDILEGPDGPPLPELDAIPSPFAMGLADTSRGFVYYETSRGCPYRCAFCMSALDQTVRSYSMDRIRSDLRLLMNSEVRKVKLVDRTFNYNPRRARDIFAWILEHNRSTHFHFEIGAHLIDEETIDLLSKVPPDMFQFEIGVQSTLQDTLSHIDREVDMEKLAANVRRLRERTDIHLHLDLVAGLPGEGYNDFLASIDRVASLEPHHLQLEPVKLLPGSPMRNDAALLGIRFDPNPPYTVLGTPQMSFADLEQLRTISRILDLTFNSGRFGGFLKEIQHRVGRFAGALERLSRFFQSHDLLRHPLSQRGIFEAVDRFITAEIDNEDAPLLRERLARDYALTERVSPHNPPDFFNTELSPEESLNVRDTVRQITRYNKGRDIKVQHFAAVFESLPEFPARTVLVFIYLTKTGEGIHVEETRL